MVLFEGQQPCDPNQPGDEQESKIWGGFLDEAVTISLTQHVDIVTFDENPYAADSSGIEGIALPQIPGDEAELHLRDKTKDPVNKHREGQFVLDIYIKAHAVKDPYDETAIIRIPPDSASSEPLVEILMERVDRTFGIETVDEASLYTIETDFRVGRLDVPLHDGVPNHSRFKYTSQQAIILDTDHFHRLEGLRESGRHSVTVGAHEAAMVAGLMAMARDPREFEQKDSSEE